MTGAPKAGPASLRQVAASAAAPAEALVYKIIPQDVWRGSRDIVPWSDDDQHDGFMHLSTFAQLLATAARHYSGVRGLVALEIRADALTDLRFEPSRDGCLFPHLYGPLPRCAVIRAAALEPDGEGFRIGGDVA